MCEWWRNRQGEVLSVGTREGRSRGHCKLEDGGVEQGRVQVCKCASGLPAEIEGEMCVARAGDGFSRKSTIGVEGSTSERVDLYSAPSAWAVDFNTPDRPDVFGGGRLELCLAGQVGCVVAQFTRQPASRPQDKQSIPRAR